MYGEHENVTHKKGVLQIALGLNTKGEAREVVEEAEVRFSVDVLSVFLLLKLFLTMQIYYCQQHSSSSSILQENKEETSQIRSLQRILRSD